MKWEKEVKKRRYTLPGNGSVVDDIDATQIGRMAENEGWNEAIDKVIKEIKGSEIRGLTTEDILKLKRNAIANSHNNEEGERDHGPRLTHQ